MTHWIHNLDGAQVLGLLIVFFFGGFVLLPRELWMRHFWYSLVPALSIGALDAFWGHGRLTLKLAEWFFAGLSRPGGWLVVGIYLFAWFYFRTNDDLERLDIWFTGGTVALFAAILAGNGVQSFVVDLFGDTEGRTPVGFFAFLVGAGLMSQMLAVGKIEQDYPFIIKGWDYD
jgi:hypothetical protein